VAKTTHSHTGGGGIFNLGRTLLSSGITAVISGSTGSLFTRTETNQVYFVSSTYSDVWFAVLLTIGKGNWLRDYSQAVDVGALSSVTAETVIMLIQVLSFMVSFREVNTAWPKCIIMIRLDIRLLNSRVRSDC
jgi:hypothetical protein